MAVPSSIDVPSSAPLDVISVANYLVVLVTTLNLWVAQVAAELADHEARLAKLENG